MLIIPFNIENDMFALGIGNITEIIPVVNIITIPDSNKFIIGMINYRGNIIPLIDLKKIISGTDTNFFLSSRIIIIKENDTNANAVLIEKLTDTMEIEEKNIDYDSAELVRSAYLKGLIKYNNQIIKLLNTDSIFDLIFKA